MKLLNITLLSVAMIFMAGCTKEFEGSEGENERSIISITFENQIGPATIAFDADDNASATFYLNTGAATLSAVPLKVLELSYGATADVAPGAVLNFDNPANTAFIRVTAASGKQRDWQIIAQPFSEPLLGTWQIDGMWNYGGRGAEWGGAGLEQMNGDGAKWLWPNDYSVGIHPQYGQNGVNAEMDNTLTFTLEGVTASGDPWGNCINDAGTDGAYANFIFMPFIWDNPSEVYDVNTTYRKIPSGTSRWERNSMAGTISFYKDDILVSTARFAGTGTENLAGQGAPFVMTIPNSAFVFTLHTSEDWVNGEIYKASDRFVYNPFKYWILVHKL